MLCMRSLHTYILLQGLSLNKNHHALTPTVINYLVQAYLLYSGLFTQGATFVDAFNLP